MERGLFETHIHVANLERSAAFYEEILGLELGHYTAERRAKFYWLGGRGKAMLGVWEIPAEEVKREHFAFATTVEELETTMATLTAKGVQLRNFKNDGLPHQYVIGWMPAISFYFADPDGHSIEYLAMLEDEPRPDLGLVPWEEWERMHGRPL